MQKRVWILLNIMLLGGVNIQAHDHQKNVMYVQRGGARNISRRLRGSYVSGYRTAYPAPVVINWQKDILGPLSVAATSNQPNDKMYVLLTYKQRDTDMDVQTRQRSLLIDLLKDPEHTFSGAGCYQLRALYGTRAELKYSAQKGGWAKEALEALW